MEATSYIEISESALANNFDYIRSHLSPSCTLSHVVKGNAYGHGIEVFVPLAVKNGARHFSVFDAHEAYKVKQVVDKEVQIMIMGMINTEQLSWAIEQEVEFFVFERERLEQSIRMAQEIGKPARIHLELETGLNRSGFEVDAYQRAADLIKKHSNNLKLMGFCTHYAGAESIANHLRIKQQIRNFKRGVKFFKANNIEADKHHTACSAAVVRLPKTRMDLVRVGILQYGFWPSVETFIDVEGSSSSGQDPLKRVISWKSRVMNLKRVSKGQYIGYGSSYLATQAMTVAVVPVGYAHGFARSLSNAGRALIRGIRVPVIGVVNMNVMMLDATHLEGLETGDEVVLIGSQGEQNISVSSFSDYSETMNYELLARLPLDIPRYIVN
jgi:alanine racemase